MRTWSLAEKVLQETNLSPFVAAAVRAAMLRSGISGDYAKVFTGSEVESSQLLHHWEFAINYVLHFC